MTLKIKDLEYNVDNKKILRGIDFEVKTGEFVVITGPNGGGKSTLLELIAGVKNADSGQILLDNKDITSFSITERAQASMALAFQRPLAIKGITVQELLRVAAPKARDVSIFLSKVGLNPSEYLERELSPSLSGGEAKRIELASVLARDTQLMLFDEPEAGIDIWSFENLTSLLKDLKARNHTIVVVSHQERILDIADKVLTLKNGKLVEGIV